MHSCHVALRVGKDDVYFVSKAATGGFEDKDLCNNSVRIKKRERQWKRGNLNASLIKRLQL